MATRKPSHVLDNAKFLLQDMWTQRASRWRRPDSKGFSLSFDLRVGHGRNRISRSGLNALVVLVTVVVNDDVVL